MSSRWSAFGLWLLASCVLLVGCRVASSITGPAAGRHRITIEELALSDSDFTRSALGSPKPIVIRAIRDGADVAHTRVEGYRGRYDPRVSFEIDYHPASRYEFKIEEVGIITAARSWSWSSDAPGNWPFAGRKSFGSGSLIAFRDEKVP